MTDECQIGKEIEGNGRCLTEALYIRISSKGSEKTTEVSELAGVLANKRTAHVPNRTVHLGFGVLTAVVMNAVIFWHTAPCRQHVTTRGYIPEDDSIQNSTALLLRRNTSLRTTQGRI